MKDSIAASADEQPERRKQPAEGGIGTWPKQTKSFLEDVRAETRRVTWPTFQQVRSTTIVVLVTVAFFSAYLGLLDYFYNRAMNWILKLGQ